MKTAEIQPELLQAQIEGFTNFETELIAGKTGVKSMMANASSRDLWQVAPDAITVLPGYNPRVQNKAYFEGVEMLPEQIETHGFYQDKPLSCYIAKIDGEDRLVLQDGHRRYAAALRAIEKGAPIKSLPVVLKEKANNSIDLTLSLLHSNEGQPFTTYEKAVIAKRLSKFGWTNKQIAEEFRVTATNVGQLLVLAGAPQAITELVQNGNMSFTAAYQLMMAKGAEEASKIATEAVNKAKGAGKGAVTAQDLAPSDLKAKYAKKHAYDLYRLLKKYREMGVVEKHITDRDLIEIDEMIADIEKKPKVKAEPKPKKEPKPPKAPKAAKVPVAKKIATVAAKKSAKGDKPTETAAELFDKAARDGKGAPAQARRSDMPQRRSER